MVMTITVLYQTRQLLMTYFAPVTQFAVIV